MESRIFHLYQIFYTVANTQAISPRHARELYISQPAISKAIQKLEEQRRLRVTLFYRNSSRGVSPDPRGYRCSTTHVQDCLSDASPSGEERLTRSVEATGDSGTLQIGVTATLVQIPAAALL